MSEQPASPQEPNPHVPAPAPSTNSSWIGDFVTAYWLRLFLLFVAIAVIIGFVGSGFDFLSLGAGVLFGLIRGLTRYRSFLRGKPMGQIVAEERYRRLERRVYNERIGSVDLGTAPGMDHMNAFTFKMMGFVFRLMIFMVVWPLVETFFQLRFLIPALQDARQQDMSA